MEFEYEKLTDVPLGTWIGDKHDKYPWYRVDKIDRADDVDGVETVDVEVTYLDGGTGRRNVPIEHDPVLLAFVDPWDDSHDPADDGVAHEVEPATD